MKKKITSITIVITLIILSAFKIAENIIRKLGMEEKTAQSYILANMIGRHDTGPMEEDVMPNSFDIPYAKLLPSIIAGNKAEAAAELCTYVKSYVNSEEFITDYNNRKEDAMPLRDNKGRNITSLKKDKIVIELNIKHYPNDVSYVAEQQKLLDETQKSIDEITTNAKKPFPNKDRWEKMYPANPEVFIKQRLNEYLALVATVDFNAALNEADKYQKRTFVNPAYEKKNFKWKACFRAGKEVNDVVTAFVKDWLKGEIISATKTKMPVTENEKIAESSNTQNSAATSAQKNNQQVKENEKTAESSIPQNNIDTPAQKDDRPVKEKKGLLNKIKSKTKALINN